MNEATSLVDEENVRNDDTTNDKNYDIRENYENNLYQIEEI